MKVLDGIQVPTLVIRQAPDGLPSMDIPELHVDGQRVPWPTVGSWRVTFDGGFVTLTVEIPVRIAVEPPAPTGA